MMHKLLNITEVSQTTRLPEATIRWQRHRNVGIGAKAGKIGRRLFWREVDVIRYIDSQFSDDDTRNVVA